jgi:hypothetical protein
MPYNHHIIIDHHTMAAGVSISPRTGTTWIMHTFSGDDEHGRN